MVREQLNLSEQSDFSYKRNAPFQWYWLKGWDLVVYFCDCQQITWKDKNQQY